MSPEPGPILVFDGVCVLCSRSVQFVLRHDRKEQFRFATTQSATGRKLMVAHGLDPDAPLSVLLVEGAQGYTESTAMLRVLKRFGGAWPALAFVLACVPRLLRDPVYRWIARHRYRWFGRIDVCYLPAPGQAARFMP
jgi:predicted DCC family thiol-disulfide oxidoreductase YuxK